MRLFAPVLGILLLAGVIGCGGTAASDGTSTDSGGTGTTARAAVGQYTTTLAGTDTASVTYTGTGTATAASDGTITVAYSSVDSVGPTTTLRTLTAAVATTGTVTGTLAAGGSDTRAVTGSLAKNSNGTYLLTVVSTTPTAATETDLFTLTIVQPSTGTFTGPNTGTDNRGGTYSGTGTLTVASGGTFNLTYGSNRFISGLTFPQTHSISATLLSNGTFSGSLSLGTTNVIATGTWVLNSDSTVTLTLKYDNNTYAPTATTTETLVFTHS